MLKPFTIFVVASIASVAASVPSIAQDAIVIAGYGGSTEKLLRDKSLIQNSSFDIMPLRFSA